MITTSGLHSTCTCALLYEYPKSLCPDGRNRNHVTCAPCILWEEAREWTNGSESTAVLPCSLPFFLGPIFFFYFFILKRPIKVGEALSLSPAGCKGRGADLCVSVRCLSTKLMEEQVRSNTVEVDRSAELVNKRWRLSINTSSVSLFSFFFFFFSPAPPSWEKSAGINNSQVRWTRAPQQGLMGTAISLRKKERRLFSTQDEMAKIHS